MNETSMLIMKVKNYGFEIVHKTIVFSIATSSCKIVNIISTSCEQLTKRQNHSPLIVDFVFWTIYLNNCHHDETITTYQD